LGGNILEYKIEYNKAIEFISAVYKYGTNKMQQINWNSKELQGDLTKGILDFSPSEDVKEWLNYVDKNISPFFMNNIIFLVSKFPAVLDFCFELIIIRNLDTPLELIEALNEASSNKLIHSIYDKYSLGIPFESDDELIKNTLTNLYNSEIACLFIHIKNNHEIFKNEIIKTFETFYNLFYKPFEKKVYDFMAERCIELNKLFQKDPMYFINTIGLGDYTKILEDKKKLRMFASFYMDLGLNHYYIDDTFIMQFGHYIEHEFNIKLMQDKCKALFKALADEKRLEIIRLTSKRPWYNKELADYFNLTTATLSYHLNLLLDLGILNFEPSISNRYYYTTNKQNLKALFEAAFNEIVGSQ